MVFKLINILESKRQPLTRKEKLQLEADASTRKSDHEQKYAAIADLASEQHEQRLADQGKVGVLEEATNAALKFEVNEKRRKRLIDQMRVTKPKKEGE